MERLVARIAIALGIVAVVSFGLSRTLLGGEDPTGWWNFVPAYVFYATIFVLFPLLGVAGLIGVAVSAERRSRDRR
jgi:hypothetical protein